MNRFFAICISIVLLGFFVVVSVQSALRESLTFDEIVHIEEGYHAWLDHTFHVDTNNPPLIRELAVLPLLLIPQTHDKSAAPNIQAFPARFVIIILGVLLGAGIMFVGSRYFGFEAGLFALAVYVFDPMILGYAHLVTQDLGSALFFFLGYMSLIWLIKYPTWIMFVVHGMCMGLMAATKITTLPYYVLADIIIVVFVMRGLISHWFRTNYLKICLSVGIFFLVIWSTYFFRWNVIVAPGDAHGRMSTYIREIANTRNIGFVSSILTVLEKQPVPLGDYVGVIKNTVVRSIKPQEVYFLGATYIKSHWYFMPVMFMLKTSLPLLLLFCVGLFSLKRSRIIFLAPILSIFVVSSLSGMQPLVRYILPVYPFLIIVAGASLTSAKSRLEKVLLLILILWHIAGSLSFFPHFISYGNDLAGDRRNFVTKFSDSNLDWGQSLPDMKSYIARKKPSTVRFSYFGRDDAGKYGMPSNFLYGSYKFNEICAFHEIKAQGGEGADITAISATNWYTCGYHLDPEFSLDKRKSIVGNSILVF